MTRILNLMGHLRAANAGDPAPEVPELSCGETSSSDDNSAPSICTVDSDSATATPLAEGVCAQTVLNIPARYSRIHPDHQTPLNEKARSLLSKEDQKWLDYARALRRRDRRLALCGEDIISTEWDNDKFSIRPPMMQEGCLGDEEAEDDDDDDGENDEDDDGEDDEDDDGIFYLVPADKAPFPPYRLALPLEVPPGHDACDATGIFLCQPAHMCPDAQYKATAVARGRQFGFFNPWRAIHPDLSAHRIQAISHGQPGEGDGCGMSPHPPNSEESAGNKQPNSSKKRAGYHAHSSKDEWAMIDGIWVRN